MLLNNHVQFLLHGFISHIKIDDNHLIEICLIMPI